MFVNKRITPPTMVNSCCVDGCLVNDSISKDIIFFKFPTSRLLRAKWLDAIKLSSKDAVNASVCSKHFLTTDYEQLRGRTRLKSHVVPTVFDENASQSESKTDVPTTEVSEDKIKDDVNQKTDKPQTETDDKEDRLQEREDCSDRVENKVVTKDDNVEQNCEKSDMLQEEPIETPQDTGGIEKDHIVKDICQIEIEDLRDKYNGDKSHKKQKELTQKSQDTNDIGKDEKIENTNKIQEDLKDKSQDRDLIVTNDIVEEAEKIQEESRDKSQHIDSSTDKNEIIEDTNKTQNGLIDKSHDLDSNTDKNYKVGNTNKIEKELGQPPPDTDKNAKVGDKNKIEKELKQNSQDIGKISKDDKIEDKREKIETLKESRESPVIEIKEIGEETIEICDIEKSISTHIVINDADDSSNDSFKTDERNKRNGKKRKRDGKSKVLGSTSVASVPQDIEDLLTNYHIKQNNIHSLDNFEAKNVLGTIDIEEELPPLMTGSDPVFIEVAVDQDPAQGGDGRDCLMVLESVQVEVDPSELMLEQDFEIASDDLDDEPIAVDNAAISLLTSSDEDDVIIEEPHIDTVEVSDETDEDDKPLVKLLHEAKKFKKKRPNKVKNGEVLMWGLCEYYCVDCQFRTTSKSEYNKHRLEHNKVLLMCQLCGYMTSSEVQLAKHEKQHKDYKRYQCHLCEFKAKHNMSLIYHLKTHKAKKLKCKKCKTSATSESELLRHMVVCRKVNIKNKNIRCDQCSYRTDRPSDLRRHKKVHKASDDDDEEYLP